jgi:hypothetical protein
MSINAMMPGFDGLSGASWTAVEHAELVVALSAAVTAVHDNGLIRMLARRERCWMGWLDELFTDTCCSAAMSLCSLIPQLQ